MKNKKVIALLCSVSMAAVSICGCGAQVSEEEQIMKSIQEMDDVVKTLESANIIKHSDTAGKEETVYVLLDANGNENQTIVSEWLKNPSGEEIVADTSFLQDLEVVKGDASFVVNEDSSVVWNTDGSDVYYQGRTDKEIPVNVSVSYELDGQSVDADQIDHATGHLKVTYDYTNNATQEVEIDGECRTIYQPFTMITGAMFDNENASNITVSDGKSINSGDYTVVFGLAMPGLAESLGIDELAEEKEKDIHIPNSVVIEADVVDFSMPMTVTVASNNALEEIGIDDFDSLDDLKEKANELSDGMDQLMDGASQLNDGIGSLSDGTMQLWDGTLDLVTGAGDLDEGAHSLSNGAAELRNGAQKLADGTSQVNQGANALKDGLHQLQDKTPALASGVNTLADGAKQLNGGLETINGNSEALKQGAAQLAAGAGQLAGAMDVDLSALTTGASQLSAGANAVVGYGDALAAYSNSANSFQTLAGLLNVYVSDIPDEQKADYTDLIEINQMVQQYASGVASINASGVLNNAKENLQNIAAGADALNAGINGEGGLAASLTTAKVAANQINAGAVNLQNGVNAYTDGVASAANGAMQLQGGLAQLQSQLPTLTDGVNKLTDGADTLADGTGELASGANTLANGSKTLADGAAQLADGTSKLSNGTGDLKDGVAKLSDGVEKLLDGSGQLKDGVFELNDEGISKITDLVNNDIEKYYDRLCAVRDFAREYTSFAGANDDTENTVKFIYKTEPVKR